MTIAIISAFSIGSYHESVAIALLFKLGEFIEDKAIQKTNKNINSIASIQVKNANLIKGKDVKVVNAKEVLPNQEIVIKPGEIVPVDLSLIHICFIIYDNLDSYKQGYIFCN